MGALRYKIPVPERTRIIWVSAEAKAIWEPRLSRINRAWAAVERESVGKFRAACRQSITPEELPILSQKAAESGLGLLILGQQLAGGQYQSRGNSGPIRPCDKFTYNVVLAQDMVTARAFAIAHQNGDNATMGDLLGYPPCCIKFFEQAWTNEGWMDTTWPMTHAHDGQNHVVASQRIHEHPANNILLRWLGARLVPHLPCSFGCKPTQALGSMFAQLLRSQPEEHDWLIQLLSTSVEWNAIKGTAEIRLPILKVATTTDPLTEPVSVRLEGAVELEGASYGNVFPWKPRDAKPSIQPMVFHKTPTADERLWTFNGFSSKEAMLRAHDAIVNFYFRTMNMTLEASLLDLGCGNGVLANRLSDHAHGVEVDPRRAAMAKECMSTADEATIIDWIRKAPDDYHVDVLLLMPGRLTEMTINDATYALTWIQKHCGRVLLYTYNDHDLRALSREFGIKVKDEKIRQFVSVAEMVK